ncbi:MAG: glycosyltransferase [Pseudomonadota bacterium]
MSRQAVLMHTQQFRGTGHRFRTARLAAALDSFFDVVVLDGGPPDPPAPAPTSVDWRFLPALYRQPDRVIRPVDPSLTLAQALRRRRDAVVAAIDEVRPAALMLEFYPFARHLLELELEAAIDRMRQRDFGLVLSYVRDLPINRFEYAEGQEAQLRPYLAERLPRFDAVLCHGDPSLFDLRSLFPWLPDLDTPVVHTGYVSDPRIGPRSMRSGIVLSSGGGNDARALCEAALEAWPRVRDDVCAGQSMTIFDGSYMPPADRQWLREAVVDEDRLEVRAFSADFAEALSRASLSVSRSGYNTFTDVLAAGARAVFSPTRVNDQPQRAKIIANAGLGVIATDCGDAIAAAIRTAMSKPPPRVQVKLNGAAFAAAWLRARVAAGT